MVGVWSYIDNGNLLDCSKEKNKEKESKKTQKKDDDKKKKMSQMESQVMKSHIKRLLFGAKLY